MSTKYNRHRKAGNLCKNILGTDYTDYTDFFNEIKDTLYICAIDPCNPCNPCLKFYTPAICPGVETKIWAPWAMRKSKSRKPQSTLMHGIPLFFAVITSTSLSPM